MPKNSLYNYGDHRRFLKWTKGILSLVLLALNVLKAILDLF